MTNAPVKRVLVVDDSSMIRKAIEQYLLGNGFLVVGQAGNGQEALELLDTTVPDIVTLDITMPKMDGLTCLDEILKRKSTMKVIVISAVSKKHIAIEALNRGAKRYLRKPFSEKELLGALQKMSDD